MEVESRDIINKDGGYISVVIPDTGAATGTNYQHFFIARHPIEIMRVSWAYRTKSVAGGVFQVEILPQGVAKSSGSVVCTCAIDGTANTVYTYQGSQLGANRIVKENERIGLVDFTLTDLVGLVVTIYYKVANNGNYK